MKNGSFSLEIDGKDDIYSWTTDRQHEVRPGLGRNDKNEVVGILKTPDGKWRNVSDTPWMQAGLYPYAFEDDPRYAIAVGPANGGTDSIVRLDLVDNKIVEVLHEHPEYDVLPLFEMGRLIGFRIPAQDRAWSLTDPKWAALYQSLRKATRATI